MKIAVSAKQIVHFRKVGRAVLEEIPFNLEWIAEEKRKTPARDLWRTSIPLKKWIQQTLAPIALELTGKPRLRLACDQIICPPLAPSPLKDFFSFQGIACFCVIFQNPEDGTVSLEVFEPSCLGSWVPPTAFYLVALGQEPCLLTNNPKDPFTLSTRNLGYVFGDHLRNELHPLLIRP